jgi:hypothetical protein
MGHVTRVLLLLAVVVPVTAYVAGSLTAPGAPTPADHSPVILRDAPSDPTPTTDTATEPDTGPAAPPPDRQRGDRNEARIVTPQPTPVGEDDDDEWDDGDDGDDGDDDDDSVADRPISALTVAAVTFANGGDNIGVYVPVFLTVGTAAVVAYCVVFLALVLVLVLAAKFVATRKPIAEVLERWEHVLFPLVLILLGLVILIEGGAFGL